MLLVTYIELDVAGRQLCLFMFLSLSVSVRSGVEFNLTSQHIVTNSGVKGPVCFIGCTWSRGYHWRRDYAPVLTLYALVKSTSSGLRFRLRSSRLERFAVFGQADSHDEFRLKYLLKLIFNLAFRLYAVQVFLKHTLIVSETVKLENIWLIDIAIIESTGFLELLVWLTLKHMELQFVNIFHRALFFWRLHITWVKDSRERLWCLGRVNRNDLVVTLVKAILHDDKSSTLLCDVLFAISCLFVLSLRACILRSVLWLEYSS